MVAVSTSASTRVSYLLPEEVVQRLLWVCWMTLWRDASSLAGWAGNAPVGLSLHGVSGRLVRVHSIYMLIPTMLISDVGCIEWFAPQLTAIANTAAASSTLDLHISIFVTCICNPDAVPPIPNSDVTIFRPSVTSILRELTTPPSAACDDAASLSSLTSSAAEHADMEELAEKAVKCKLPWAGLGGGVAVCASGPETLIRESQNAVAKLGVMKGRELGGIALHTELFAL